jgi:hypothetical protein
METTIRVTEDREALRRVWGAAYAQEHAGKVYRATIEADGWATVDGGVNAKFPPNVFTVTQ